MERDSHGTFKVVVKERRSVSLLTANVLGILVLGAILFLFGMVYGWHGGVPEVEALLTDIGNQTWLLGILIGGILAHEGIHAVAMWGVGGIPWSEIDGGIEWQFLAPYVHTSRVMTAGTYRVVALSPGIILGLLPALWGLGTGSLLLTLYGALFTGAAGGDFLSVWNLRGVPAEAWVQDAEDKCGCEVLIPVLGEEDASPTVRSNI